MAYSKKRTSRKSVKSRSMKKTMASKTRPMSDKQKALQTGYAKALINPQTGPLVGVPTFVPIDTHRVRSKCCGTISLNGSGRIFFNPLSMGANDYRSIRAFGVDSNTGTVLDGGSFTGLFSNAPYSKDDYMVTSLVADNIHVTQSDIDNNDGVRSRVVGASFTVRPISNSQVRDGVLIALHEKHHKTLETFTGGQMAAQDNAIIKSCSSGNAVTLLYRPVKPEEVDEFQLSANRLNGHISVNSGDGDGALFDGYPGYMAVEWTGSGIQNFWVEAHAIVEYAGEIVTTLAKPPHHGDPKKAEPNDIPHVGRQVTMVEASQQGPDIEVTPEIPDVDMPSVPEIAPDQDINPGTSALEFDPNEAYRELLAQLSDAMDDYQEAVEEFVFEGHDQSGDVAKTLMGIADEKAKASNWIAPDEKRKKLRAAKKASMKATKKKSQNALAALGPNYRKTELLLAIRQKGKEVDALQAKVQKGRVKSAVARIEQGVPLVPSEMDVSITDRVDDATKAQWDKALRKRRRRENRKREGERSGDSEDPIFGNTKEQYKAKHTRKTPIEIPYPNLVQSERKTRIKLPKGKDRLWGRYAS